MIIVLSICTKPSYIPVQSVSEHKLLYNTYFEVVGAVIQHPETRTNTEEHSGEEPSTIYSNHKNTHSFKALRKNACISNLIKEQC